MVFDLLKSYFFCNFVVEIGIFMYKSSDKICDLMALGEDFADHCAIEDDVLRPAWDESQKSKITYSLWQK